MVRICSNCKKPLGEKEPLEDKDISHGLCPECAKELEEEFNKPETQKIIEEEIKKNELRQLEFQRQLDHGSPFFILLTHCQPHPFKTDLSANTEE